jgi:plasmid stabilization system protein ParE
MKNLRIYPLNKNTVAAFAVDEDQQAVRILNIFYGGRDFEAIMSTSRL